jgi:RNA polymerase sigma-70 factor, ECF subfamily
MHYVTGNVTEAERIPHSAADAARGAALDALPQESIDKGLSKDGFVEEALPRLDAVYRFALRLAGGDADRAEDLVQETFLRAYRSWSSFTRGSNVQAWLFTICRNVFLREQERRARREIAASTLDMNVEAVSEAALTANEAGLDPATRFFDSFIDEEVLAAVDALPDEFRETVVLSDLEGLAYAEVADVLGVPVGTVKSRLYRGRRLLQTRLLDYAREMGYARVRGGSE